MRKFWGAVLACALTAGNASAACWTPEQVAAASIRDLDTMLMVSALRCRTSGSDLMARYNEFVVQDRATLTQVNELLREHFRGEVGAKEALNAYDNYVTRVANRYGAGAEGLSCEDMSSIVAATAAEDGSFASLAAVAERAQVSPVIDGERCPIVLAAG